MVLHTGSRLFSRMTSQSPDEISELVFPAGSHSWYPLETSFMSHNERIFIYSSLDTIGENHLASLPTLFQANGINVLVTESDIEDYPGMWIHGGGPGKISGQWPHYPKSEKLNTDRNLFVTSTEDFIAKTRGTRLFPWRVFVISNSDAGLVESDLVYRLAASKSDCRYKMDQTREGGMGLVECQ